MVRTAHILIVGDEVLAAEVRDENGPYLLSICNDLGTRVQALCILTDVRSEVATAVRTAASAADWVLVAGGIGPTHDDCTRAAVAEALGRRLLPHPEARSHLEGVYAGALTPAEMTMAELPEGAELLTAPGCKGFGFRADRVLVFPGVPALLRTLVSAHRGLLSGRPWVRREVVTSLREGLVVDCLAELAEAWPAVKWGSYPQLKAKGWRLRLVLRAPDEETARRAGEALQRALKDLGAG